VSAEPVARRAIDFSMIHRMRLACDTGAGRMLNDNSSSATYKRLNAEEVESLPSAQRIYVGLVLAGLA
jgi:hypothetical protein